MVKTTLYIRPVQRQRISPYLERSIAVLTAPSTSLRDEIQLALDLNPFLELQEQPLIRESDYPSTSIETLMKEVSFFKDGNNPRVGWGMFSTLPSSGSSNTDEPLMGENVAPLDTFHADAQQQTLAQQVRDSLLMHQFDPRSQMIAEALIGNLDSLGYLDASFEDLRSILPPGIQLRDREFEQVLSKIQGADLAGIGARDLRECLLLQLHRLNRSAPEYETAIKLVENHLTSLADHKTDKLLQALQVSKEVLSLAIDQIRNLDPEPGRCYSQDSTSYVTPDVIVSRKEGTWCIGLNPYLYPTIQLNPSYATERTQIREKNARDFLEKQLEEARWLIGSINQRHETILRIACEIVRHQARFFCSNQLQPLTQRIISESLRLHPSTISRATRGKYMLTPKGTLEFRAFFSPQINVGSDLNYSTSMAKFDVRRMIELESPERPLSDQAISRALQAKGIQIARRTVTKYRNQMFIPSSSRRHHSK